MVMTEVDTSTCKTVSVKPRDKSHRGSTPKVQEMGLVGSVEAGEQ